MRMIGCNIQLAAATESAERPGGMITTSDSIRSGPEAMYAIQALDSDTAKAIIERGSVEDWLPVLEQVEADPDGQTAEVLLNVCATQKFAAPIPPLLMRQLVLSSKRRAETGVSQ